MLCAACKKKIDRGDSLQCNKCKECFHYQCLNMTSAFFRERYNDLSKHWICPNCESVMRRRRNDETPTSPAGLGKQLQSLDDANMSCDEYALNSIENEASASKSSTNNAHKVKDGYGEQTGNKESASRVSSKPGHEIEPISLMQIHRLLESNNLSIVKAIQDTIQGRIETAVEAAFAQLKETIKTEIEAISDNFNMALATVSSRVDSFEARISSIENRLETNCSDGQTGLAQEIERLKLEINDRDQELLMNDLQITGLPELPNENPTHLVTLVCKKLGVTVVEHDVASAMRVGPRATGTGSVSADDRPASRVLVVRLVRRAMRDDVLRAARVRRGLDSEGLGLPGAPTRLYINERLTKDNRLLFNKARLEARRLGWRYVWTRHGTVFARREHAEPACRIRKEADLKRVFEG